MSEGQVLPDEPWTVEAEVSVIPALTFDDMVPVATDLNERVVRVRSSRTNLGPPMAAGPDLAVDLIFYAIVTVAAAEALRKVVGLLVEDVYKAVRAGLLVLVGKANERDKSRAWNLGITVGSQHFYFQTPMDDAEFVRRLIAMREVIGRIPDSLVDGTRTTRPEPGGGGWWWSPEQGLWIPTPGVEEAMREVDGS